MQNDSVKLKNILEKIIEYGLYLLIFFLPIQTRWIIKAGDLEYSSVSLYGTDILLILVFFIFLINLILKRRIRNYELGITNVSEKSAGKKDNHKLIWFLLAGLELFVFISIFFAADKLIAIYAYLKFLLGIGLFWLVLKVNYSRVKLIFSFILGASLQAMLGIWQFLYQLDFQNKWLGKAVHDASTLGTSVVETAGDPSTMLGAGRFLRAYGGLDHPNVLGGILVIAIFMLILLKINSKHEILNPKQFQNSKSKILNYLKLLTSCFSLLTFYSLLLTLSSALFFTFSRAAWIGLAAGLLCILFLAIIKKDLDSQKIILKSILAIGIVFFVLYIQYGDLVKTRISGDSRLEVKSNVERLSSYKQSFAIIKRNLFFGVGAGNYTLVVKNELDANRPAYFYQPTHNVYLLMLAEIGIFGFLFFIGFLLFTFYFLLKKIKEDKYAAYKLSLLAGLCTMFLFDHWWWSLHFGGLLFWLILGLIYKNDN